MNKNQSELKIEAVPPLFSLRRLAEYFGCFTDTGSPATDTIRDWWHSGKLPPPDIRMSKKAIFWKPETIKTFVDSGGVL